jgi:hypothetical protein
LTIQPQGLAWEGCLNVCDLGGLPTEDGSDTRYCRVIRADSVQQLTELERRYGGAAEFLRSTGLSGEDLGLAAARLRA